jgi:CheY-like chemotaxis protein
MPRGENDHAKLETPFLILLDLNMPRMGGIEFLKELRGDPELRRTLVFVMTTSAAEEDRERAYEYNVAGYVLKDRPRQTFVQSIAALESYWRTIELPD